MGDPRYYGESAPHELPESFAKTVENGGVRTVRKWRGQASLVEAIAPLPGSTSGDGIVQVPVQIEHESGGLATLTVTYFDEYAQTGFVAIPRQQNPRVEISFVQVDKPIESHPTKGLLNTDGSPDYEELGKLQAWRDAPATRKSQFQFAKSTVKNPDVEKEDDWDTLDGNALKIAGKLVAGMEAYIMFVPVIRQIGVSYNKPTLSAGGKIETPPESAPGTWQYLRLGDNCTQRDDGTWELVSVWQGADKIDTDYYS